MKAISIALAISGSVFMSCSQHSTPASDQSVDALSAKRWYLRNISIDTVNLTVMDSIAFLKFNPEKSSAGGKGGCNNFGSNYSIDGNSIRFTELFSTKMFCEQTQHIENNFFTGLNRVNRYHIDGNKLHLKEGDKVLLEFEQGSE